MSAEMKLDDATIAELVQRIYVAGRNEGITQATGDDSAWAARKRQGLEIIREARAYLTASQPSRDAVIEEASRRFEQAMNECTVFGVEPDSMHRLLLHYQSVEMIRSALKSPADQEKSDAP